MSEWDQFEEWKPMTLQRKLSCLGVFSKIEILLVIGQTSQIKKSTLSRFCQISFYLFFNICFWTSDLLTKYKQSHKPQIQKWKVTLLPFLWLNLLLPFQEADTITAKQHF